MLLLLLYCVMVQRVFVCIILYNNHGVLCLKNFRLPLRVKSYIRTISFEKSAASVGIGNLLLTSVFYSTIYQRFDVIRPRPAHCAMVRTQYYYHLYWYWYAAQFEIQRIISLSIIIVYSIRRYTAVLNGTEQLLGDVMILLKTQVLLCIFTV